MKKNILFLPIAFLLALTLLSFNKIIYAEINPEEQVKKYQVTFPIVELDNCTSFSTCRTYCNDATHSDACIAFAKKKGFYKEQEVDTKKQALIQTAKTELGCDSESSCRATCEQEANFEKCQKFAQKNGLGEGQKDQKDPADKAILQKAKTILGCDSPTSCKSICEQETNREKCSAFAKQAGLEGGIRHAGPGGCNSEQSCRSYCEKSPDECKKFAGQNNQKDDRGGKNKGPGGCDSESSCRKYCTEHPSECQRPPGESGEKSSEQRGSGEMRGPGGCDSEASCRAYCEKNPAECQKFSGSKERGLSGMPGPNVSGPPPSGGTPPPFISQFPDRSISPRLFVSQFPPQEMRQQSEEQFREQRKRIEEQSREFMKRTEEQQREEKKDVQEQRREQRKDGEEQRREGRKDFQEIQREENKQTNEFRPPENSKPPEVKGVSTVYSFFQELTKFFLGK